jgi:hypothetical protein
MSIINTLNKDTHYFTLDLHGGATLAEPLHFKQYDHNSRVLAIELTVHNVSLDLTDARVDIWVYKADGHLVQKAVDRANIDLENSTVMIPLTAQMLSVLPEIECEIVVTYANHSVLSFPTFKVQIEDSNVDVDTIVSTSEFNLFYDALYRMEEWIRDYLVKYAIIDESLTTKLAEIEREKLRIIDEFEILSADLVQNDGVRFEELKQMTIGEFNTWFTQAKAVFAYAGREIEKRFNELWEKCNDLNVQMEEIVRQADEHKVAIEQLHKHVKEVKESVDTKYAEIVVLYEDGVKKLAEMQNTFNADQAARKTAFDNAQSQRTIDFEKAQTDRVKAFETEQSNRAKAFETEQTNRTSAYNIAEAQRNTLYTNSEENRDKLFNNAEKERQQSYSEKESARALTEQNRVSAENQRAENENQRVENENQRVEDFNAMQEQFNIFITYRITE